LQMSAQVGSMAGSLAGSLFTLGLNYRTAPIAIRERVAFPALSQREALLDLRRATSADEATLVSTCNRTELYLRAASADVIGRATEWLTNLPRVAGLDLRSHLYQLHGADVPRHAFRMASGLDSMIVGEPQVLGQVKEAVRIAEDAHTLSGPLGRLFQQTFEVAKAVRSQTPIGTTSVSMAAAAVKLAAQLFGDLRETRVLLIGSGEMVQLAAAHFAAKMPREMVVANRTLSKANVLVGQLNGLNAKSMALGELPEQIHRFDIIVTSTASTLPIIGKGMIESALKARRQKPMFLVDLAVPRDIEPGVAAIENIYLHTLDSLGSVIDQNLATRRAGIAQAEAIIEARTIDFMRWLAGRETVPLIQHIRTSADECRQAELARAQRLLANGANPAQVLETLANGLMNKLLHPQMAAIRDCSHDKRDHLMAALETLYLHDASSANE
jgi:glutamyl-tRNA reductase